MSAECGMKASPAIVDAVGRARAHAPFLSLLLDREPALAAMLDEGGWPGLESARAEDDGQSVGSEEHTSELQSLMRISYAVFCLKKKNKKQTYLNHWKYDNR